MRTRLAALAAVPLLTLGAVACSSSSNSSSSTTTAASQTFSVSTDDGQVTVSLDGALPPNWPASFPVPDGAEPAGSGSLGDTATTNFVGVFTTKASPEDTYTYYQNDAGLTVGGSSSIGVGGAYVGTVEFSGDPSGRVTIVAHDDQTLIIATIQTGSSSGTTIGT